MLRGESTNLRITEGRLRHHRDFAGRYYYTLLMGPLREDFDARETARA